MPLIKIENQWIDPAAIVGGRSHISIASSDMEVEVFLSSGHTLAFKGDDAPEAARLLDSLAKPPAAASWGVNDE